MIAGNGIIKLKTAEIDPYNVATDWDREPGSLKSNFVFLAPSENKCSIKVGWIIIFKEYHSYYFFCAFDIYFS